MGEEKYLGKQAQSVSPETQTQMDFLLYNIKLDPVNIFLFNIVCRWVKYIWEFSSYHHISKKVVWKYFYTTISIWSPTNSGVKISV